jgi:carbonic anhydrase
MDFVINKNGVEMRWKDDSVGSCSRPFFKIPVSAFSEDPSNFEGGDTYIHAQSHIHLSSEHTIDGKYFAAELHMVHLNADQSRAAVLGTMIRPVLPFDNPTFEQFLNRWVEVWKAEGCDCTNQYTFDLMPNFKLDVYENMEGKDFYHYDGGLTTPPCGEIVWWNFNTEPWNISVRQFNILVDITLKYTPKEGAQCADKPQTNASRGGSTSRPPQPLNGRKVLKICSFS